MLTETMTIATVPTIDQLKVWEGIPELSHSVTRFIEANLKPEEETNVPHVAAWEEVELASKNLMEAAIQFHTTFVAASLQTGSYPQGIYITTEEA